MSRRGRVTIAVLVGVFVFFTLLGWVVDAWTDWLWFDEVSYTQVFTNVLRTRLLLFLIFGLAMALFVGGNLYLAYRLRPLLYPHSLEQQALERYRMVLTPRIGTWIALAAGVIGFFAGISAQGSWAQWLLFSNAQEFGAADPQFGVDVGFYIFKYPFWRFLLGVGMTAVVLSTLGALAVHYIYGGVRLTGQGDRMTGAARAHVTSLVAAFVLLKAVAYFLDQRGLLLAHNDGTDLYGAGYTAVNALLPAKEILAYISIVVAIAIVVFSNAVMRNLTWPGISLALLGISAVAIGGIYPWAVQSFTVNPSLRDKEAQYIQRSIDATRQAYALTDVKQTSYPANNLTPPAALATDTSIVPNIRLLDPAVVSATYTQLQQVRGFYDFGEKLDIDRYTLNGVTQDYVVGVRELDPDKLRDAQRNWLNRHTVFTHGYGLVAAPANRTPCGGQPFFTSGFLGTQKEAEPAGNEQCSSPTEQIATSQPRIYYGERMGDYAVIGKATGGGDVEYDRPTGETGDQYYTYQGTGGVEIGSMWRRLLYSVGYREANFLLSNAVNDNSRMMYIRHPRDRVEKVAPFLTLDGDPYPAAVGGRIVWIVDGYTTASTYPYAQRVNLQQATNDSLTGTGTFQLARQNINYIRNSVKATVDAYDGTVTLYAFDEGDPVLRAWNKAFGGKLIRPAADVPPELAQHFRYPADMFKVQRDLLARFHVTEANEFFSGQDFWQVPEDPAQPGQGVKQPPYYLLTQLPGQESTRFQLTAAVTPTGRQNLAALISGSYVDGRPRLDVLELPKENRIPGPGQAQQNMENEPTVRSQLTLLQSETSSVVKGNLLSLPFGGGMLYVEPIYLRSNVANPYPLMKKVLLNYGDRVALADTLQAGIKQLVDSSRPPTTQPPQGGTPQPPTATPPAAVPGDLAAAAAKVRTAIDALRAAQASGNFEEYGRALANLDAALKEFEAAQRRAGTTPGATPTPAPSPSG
ncbi:MAG TPA: UPF0182 family protein [Micromonosporaceae bacterium]|nr:UPF0182 family protein [Micromonosporaceae bacterium]